MFQEPSCFRNGAWSAVSVVMVELRSLQQAGCCTWQGSVTARGALPGSAPATADCPGNAKGVFDPELLPSAHSAHQVVPILPGDAAISHPGRSDAPGVSLPCPKLRGCPCSQEGLSALQSPATQRDTQLRTWSCCPTPSSSTSFPRVLTASGCRGYPGTGPGTLPGAPPALSLPHGPERSHRGSPQVLVVGVQGQSLGTGCPAHCPTRE